jgi:putative N-acetyltransferase (TIGR04045 family)
VSVAVSRSVKSARPFGATRCSVAQSGDERERHFAVRHAVFVVEQALFSPDDRDDRDRDPATLHAVGFAGDEIAGAVRLYPVEEPGVWKGDRLAVLPGHRKGALGAQLVRFAVATAGELGGRVMVAMIQLPNVEFFSALGWRESGPIRPYHGVAHQPMEIALRPVSPSR